MALNLVRNSKVFFTTNVNSATGVVPNGGFGALNTYEISVLDGFTFSQNSNTETITLSETGNSPVRGQSSYNTSLAPVDFSFSTYIRPRNQTTKITADESVLWNALFTSKPVLDSTAVILGTGGTGTISGVTYTPGSGTVVISGTTLPSASLAVNDVVVISGLVTTAGAPSAEVNGYGTVTASSATSITVVLGSFNASATATTVTTPTTVTLTKQGITQVVKIGTGGTGSITGVTYSFNNTTGNGAITVAGTAMPTFAANDYLVLSGIASGSITGATAEQINQPCQVVSSSATSLVLNLLTPPTGAVTITTPASVNLTKSAWAENGAVFSLVSTASSDIQQLQKFGMLFLVDNVMYAADNCALNQASIDFAIDGIATVSWTGQATALRRLNATAAVVSATSGTFNNSGTGVGVYGKYTQKDTNGNYITNKLSLVTLKAINTVKNSAGTTIINANDSYSNIAITGGNLTINNNITYLTPAILGVVNAPATYFQGTRAVSGNITAYLKTGGSLDTGELLADLLDVSSANAEVMMGLTVNVGGTGTLKVVLDMPSAVLTIPTVDVQQVVSTTINFTAEGSVPGTSATAFDLTEENDLTIRYYS